MACAAGACLIACSLGARCVCARVCNRQSIYEEKIFVDRVVQIIDEHPDDPDHPLFINYDSHIVHSPLQAPADLYHRFDFMENDWDHHRQIYAAMVAYLDSGVGRIVDALKGRGNGSCGGGGVMVVRGVVVAVLVVVGCGCCLLS